MLVSRCTLAQWIQRQTGGPPAFAFIAADNRIVIVGVGHTQTAVWVAADWAHNGAPKNAQNDLRRFFNVLCPSSSSLLLLLLSMCQYRAHSPRTPTNVVLDYDC